MQTSIANSLDHAGDEAKLDRNAKKIFSHEAVLAPLMRMCIPEFADYTDEYIIANCFDGAPEVSSHPVHQDEGRKLDGDRRVPQMNSEDSAASEQTIHYDIRFSAKVPKTDKLVRLIINVEIQVDDQLRYKVVTRGIYYCARMISAQYGTVFTHQEYQKLQKVYSIWICPESSTGEHTITSYRMERKQQLGNPTGHETDFDKLQVLVITLGPDGTESDNPLIRFLSLLLSKELPLENRKQRLEEEYNIEMNPALEEEMSVMCNLGEYIARTSRAEGHAEGRAEGEMLGTIKTLAELVRENSITIQKAAEKAGMSEAEFCKKAGLKIVQ